MGSVATKVAQSYVFPGTRIEGIEYSHEIEFLPTSDPDYSIPYVHIKHPSAKAVLFYSHGNAEDLHSVLEFLKHVSKELQISIVSFDYAGYGQHRLLDTVKPTEENVYKDALDVFDWIQSNNSYQTNELPIIVHGRSLGSAPAIYVTSQRQSAVKGLIVESGFRSISRVVSNTLHNLFDMFDNEKYIKQINVPTLFVHGKKDTVVPFKHGEFLFQNCASERKYNFWIPDGHHNDISSSYHEQLFIRLREFIYKL